MPWIIIYMGMCFGSFCQVVAYRYVKNESFIFGSSYCEQCGHLLSLLEILPLFSFLFLKGKCRYCDGKISNNHVVGELIFGLVFYGLYLFIDDNLYLFISLLICMLLFIIAWIDINTMYVYDQMIVLLGCLCFLYSCVRGNSMLFMMAGAFSISLPLFVLSKIIKDSIGFGDIELVFVMGVLLGRLNSFYAFSMAVFSATLYSLFSHQNMKNRIPFCPFLCLGFFFSLLLLG